MVVGGLCCSSASLDRFVVVRDRGASETVVNGRLDRQAQRDMCLKINTLALGYRNVKVLLSSFKWDFRNIKSLF